MENAYIITLVLLIYFNGAAIFYAYASEMYSQTQLTAQVFIVFLIPFFGALFVLLFTKSQIDPVVLRKKQEHFGFRLAAALFLSFMFTQDASESFRGSESIDSAGSVDGSSGD